MGFGKQTHLNRQNIYLVALARQCRASQPFVPTFGHHTAGKNRQTDTLCVCVCVTLVYVYTTICTNVRPSHCRHKSPDRHIVCVCLCDTCLCVHNTVIYLFMATPSSETAYSPIDWSSLILTITKLHPLTNSLTYLLSMTPVFLVLVSLQSDGITIYGVSGVSMLRPFLPFCSARNNLSVESIEWVGEAVIQPLVQSSFLHGRTQDMRSAQPTIISTHMHSHTHNHTSHSHIHTIFLVLILFWK